MTKAFAGRAKVSVGMIATKDKACRRALGSRLSGGRVPALFGIGNPVKCRA